MNDQYRELFDEVHLSESVKQNLKERAEELYKMERKKGRLGRTQKFVKAAILIMTVFALGSTAAYAASYYNEQKRISDKKASEQIIYTINDMRADITVDVTEPQEKADASFYDVKLSYLPEGYKQNKTDCYEYDEVDGDGAFCVILYHLQTEFHTAQSAEKIGELQTETGSGYYGGSDYRHFAIIKVEDKDYMIFIRGYNMKKAQKEIKKIAENASLVEVEKKSDIQASLIEWTEEDQEYAEKMRNKYQ